MSRTMKNSENPVVKFIFDRGVMSSIGIIGRNHIYLNNMYGHQHYVKSMRLSRPSISDEVSARVKQINELLFARDGMWLT